MATKSVGGYRTAASKAVMRSGRHFIQFTVIVGDDMLFGVIRPGWDVEGGEAAYEVDGHCFYYKYNGWRMPGSHEWEGVHSVKEQGDRIGMPLDLDQGSVTIWKNGEKLGVMVAEGSAVLCGRDGPEWQCTHRVHASTRVPDGGGAGGCESMGAS